MPVGMHLRDFGVGGVSKMDNSEIVDVFEKELRCVRNSEKGVCDKDCKSCEFIVNPDALMDALSIAIIKFRK